MTKLIWMKKENIDHKSPSPLMRNDVDNKPFSPSIFSYIFLFLSILCFSPSKFSAINHLHKFNSAVNISQQSYESLGGEIRKLQTDSSLFKQGKEAYHQGSLFWSEQLAWGPQKRPQKLAKGD